MQDIARKLRRDGEREVWVVSEEDAQVQCTDMKGAVWVIFRSLIQSEGRLWVDVTVGCGLDCWGNSGATYIFGQQDGEWVLEETRGAWAS